MVIKSMDHHFLSALVVGRGPQAQCPTAMVRCNGFKIISGLRGIKQNKSYGGLCLNNYCFRFIALSLRAKLVF